MHPVILAFPLPSWYLVVGHGVGQEQEDYQGYLCLQVAAVGMKVLLWMWKAEVPQMGSKLVVVRTARDCTHLQLSEPGTEK